MSWPKLNMKRIRKEQQALIDAAAGKKTVPLTKYTWKGRLRSYETLPPVDTFISEHVALECPGYPYAFCETDQKVYEVGGEYGSYWWDPIETPATEKVSQPAILEKLEAVTAAYHFHQQSCAQHEWVSDYLLTQGGYCNKCGIAQAEFQKVCNHGSLMVQEDLTVNCAFCGASPPLGAPKPQVTAAELEEASKEEIFTIPNLGGI